MPTFTRVKEILDGAIGSWKDRTGHNPLLGKHGRGFGWKTRDQLVSSAAFGLPLIAADKIAAEQGDETNLVISLRTGVAGFPRMPIDGPYVSDAEIQEIVDWINDGALDQGG